MPANQPDALAKPARPPVGIASDASAAWPIHALGRFMPLFGL
jgi:hypothetical protein